MECIAFKTWFTLAIVWTAHCFHKESITLPLKKIPETNVSYVRRRVINWLAFYSLLDRPKRELCLNCFKILYCAMLTENEFPHPQPGPLFIIAQNILAYSCLCCSVECDGTIDKLILNNPMRFLTKNVSFLKRPGD